MKNFEKYKNELKQLISDSNGDLVICEHFKCFDDKYNDCDECPFNIEGRMMCNVNKFINWLCEEHKEPIKLKQLEYDVASYYHSDTNFDTWSTLIGLKEKGHFKGVTDTSMTLREILSNCKIVSDDYDFGGNEND